MLSSLVSMVLPQHEPEQRVLKNFVEIMNFQSSAITSLYSEITVSLGRLKNMKARLQSIRDITTRANLTVSQESDEVSSSVWARLGWLQQQDIDRFKADLALLGALDASTSEAREYLLEALRDLQAKKSQMRELRTRVSKRPTLGGEIPLEVHIESIIEGMERLKMERLAIKEREKKPQRKLPASQRIQG